MTGLTIHRDAVSWDGKRTAALSDLAFSSAEDGTAALREAAATLRAEGFEALVGPMRADTWGAYRFVIDTDGRAPFLMEPPSDPNGVKALDEAGFALIATYQSAARDLAAQPAPNHAGIVLRTFDASNAEAELATIHALSSAAFATAFLYRPIPLDLFIASYRPLLPMLDPDLIFMANDEATGAPLGYLFGLPNFAEGPKPRSVILKTYASLRRGVGGALADAFHARAHDKGFATAIHALMHEANVSAQHSRKVGGAVFRRYGLWGLLL